MSNTDATELLSLVRAARLLIAGDALRKKVAPPSQPIVQKAPTVKKKKMEPPQPKKAAPLKLQTAPTPKESGLEEMRKFLSAHVSLVEPTTPFVLLAFSPDEHLFLEKVASALCERVAPACVIEAQEWNKQGKWILATAKGMGKKVAPHTLTPLSDKQTLIPLADLDTYTTEMKRALWNTLLSLRSS